MTTKKPILKASTFYSIKKIDKDFTLEAVSTPVLPEKIYGRTEAVSERVLTTFFDRSKNLGVLFSGIKGNSKTLTSIKICIDSKLPVVLITEPYVGDAFKLFLESISKEVVVFIDEFEKIYNTTELQNEFLTILDGASSTKKLYIFTSNSQEISPYLKNRPNRIFYHYKHDNLSQSVTDDIIEDKLVSKEFEADLREIIKILGSVSYDVLLNLIDEVERFKMSPKKLIGNLNIELEQSDFHVILLVDGMRIETTAPYNPLLTKYWWFDYKDANNHWHFKSFNAGDFVSYYRDETIVFEAKDKKIYFTPKKRQKISLWDEE